MSLVNIIGICLFQLDRNLLINIVEVLSAPAVCISYLTATSYVPRCL